MKKPPVTPRSICEKYAKIAQTDFAALPQIVRPVITTCSAQGIIDNGGFPFLFECDWPGLVDWNVFPDDFEAVGHTEGAEAIRAALSLFPQGQPQRDLRVRRKYIFDVLGGLDGELGTLDSAICGRSALLEQLLVCYIKAHGID